MITEQGLILEVTRLVEENRALRAARDVNAAMRIAELELEVRELRGNGTSCKNCWRACDICLDDARRCQSDHK